MHISSAHNASNDHTGDLKLADGQEGLLASISGSIEVAGDAVINNRKNKLIPAYELEIKGAWSGIVLLAVPLSGCTLPDI